LKEAVALLFERPDSLFEAVLVAFFPAAEPLRGQAIGLAAAKGKAVLASR
jgi:hypothetical protein